MWVCSDHVLLKWVSLNFDVLATSLLLQPLAAAVTYTGFKIMLCFQFLFNFSIIALYTSLFYLLHMFDVAHEIYMFYVGGKFEYLVS